jgi:hypothetical protein
VLLFCDCNAMQIQGHGEKRQITLLQPNTMIKGSLITCLFITTDNRTVMTGHEDGIIRIFDISGRCLYAIKAHWYPVLFISASHTGEVILSGAEAEEEEEGNGTTITTMDLTTGNQESFELKEKATLSSDGKFLLLCNYYNDEVSLRPRDWNPRVMKIENGKIGECIVNVHNNSVPEIRKKNKETGTITAISNFACIDSDKRYFVVLGWIGTIECFDMKTRKCLSNCCSKFASLLATRNGKYLFAQDLHREVSVFDAKTITSPNFQNTPFKSIYFPQKGDGRVDKIKVLGDTSDGEHIIVVNDEDIIEIWSLRTGKCVKTLTENQMPNTIAAITSPNGKYIFSWSPTEIKIGKMPNRFWREEKPFDLKKERMSRFVDCIIICQSLNSDFDNPNNSSVNQKSDQYLQKMEEDEDTSDWNCKNWGNLNHER